MDSGKVTISVRAILVCVVAALFVGASAYRLLTKADPEQVRALQSMAKNTHGTGVKFVRKHERRTDNHCPHDNETAYEFEVTSRYSKRTKKMIACCDQQRIACDVYRK